MLNVTDICDLYGKEVEVECVNGDRLKGILILVNKGYIVIEFERKHMIVFDAKRVIVGG